MEVSVDTYIGRRDTSNYSMVNQDGVQIMVANSIAAYIDKLDLDCTKFLFLHKLKAFLKMTNGAEIAV